MTALRILLAAEQGDPEPLDARQHPLYALQEQGALCEPSVEDMALGVVVLLPLRPPSQLLAEEEVPDAGSLDGLLERNLIEVRRVGGPWERSDVHEHLDGVGLEETKQDVQGMVRMADREEAPAHGRLVQMPARHGGTRLGVLMRLRRLGGLAAGLLSGSNGLVHAPASRRLPVGTSTPPTVEGSYPPGWTLSGTSPWVVWRSQSLASAVRRCHLHGESTGLEVPGSERRGHLGLGPTRAFRHGV